MKKIIALSLLACSAAWAQQGPGGMHRELPPEVKAAFESCKSLGNPGTDAFRTCMESKGFKRPEPPAGFKAALDACKASGATEATFQSCMEGKGFKRPDGLPPGGPGAQNSSGQGNSGQPSQGLKSLNKRS